MVAVVSLACLTTLAPLPSEQLDIHKSQLVVLAMTSIPPQPFTLYIHLVATAVFHSTIGFVTHNQPSDCLFQYITDCLTLSSGPLFHSDINSSQGWFAHECLVPDAELSLIDEQGKDTAGKLILILISVVSHCLALQRVS